MRSWAAIVRHHIGGMPADPEGPTDPSHHLRMMPLLALADSTLVEVVRAGASRAGGGPPVIIVSEADEATLVAAREAGGEIVVAVCDGDAAVRSLNTARRMGGRAVPVLGLIGDDGGPRVLGTTLDLLADEALRDANVPVPALDDDRRRSVWDQLRAAHLEERHHLVEVDGAPALAELAALGLDPPRDRWAALAAGAAGVLAGRMAAGNRRWRRQGHG